MNSAITRLRQISSHCSLKRTMMTSQHLLNADDDVLFEKVNGAGIITLNRPKALNALNLSMVNKIYPQIGEWEKDPSTTMIIMKGAGEKSFCAGGDIVDVTKQAKKENYLAGETFFREEYKLNYRIATCDVPYIALIDGICMGGGVGLSVHGDERVCTERTMFAMPETAIGLYPDVGGSYFLPRLSLHLGMYLAMSGFRLKGRDVYKAGIATRMVHSSQLEQVEKDLVNLDNPTRQDITDLLRKHHMNCQEGRERDYLVLRDYEKYMARCFIADNVQDVIKNLETDGTEWAREVLKVLMKMSPTSMAVTHKQLKLGSQLPLEECLQMELRISANMLRKGDFIEGVRSLLVDKDRNPQWNPTSVSDISQEEIDSYFVMPEGVEELDLSDA